jgi:hypothetical protein
MSKNPKYRANPKNGHALVGVLYLTGLEFTCKTLDIAYQILKLKKHKF